MAWPFKDYDFYGDRFINIDDTMWYERGIDKDTTPTECVICIEAEKEMYTKYAHPRAHLEAHTQATNIAELFAIKEKDTDEYIDYYIFFYGKEYRKIYTELYKKYKQEYSITILESNYDKNAKICQYHTESIHYHYELKTECP